MAKSGFYFNENIQNRIKEQTNSPEVDGICLLDIGFVTFDAAREQEYALRSVYTDCQIYLFIYKMYIRAEVSGHCISLHYHTHVTQIYHFLVRRWLTFHIILNFWDIPLHNVNILTYSQHIVLPNTCKVLYLLMVLLVHCLHSRHWGSDITILIHCTSVTNKPQFPFPVTLVIILTWQVKFCNNSAVAWLALPVNHNRGVIILSLQVLQLCCCTVSKLLHSWLTLPF